MKAFFGIVVLLVIAWLGYIFFFDRDNDENTAQTVATTTMATSSTTSEPVKNESDPVSVTPISHATMALKWKGLTILTDPVGDVAQYISIKPDIILVTDIHSDHLSTSTLKAVMGNAAIIAPQAVKDLLPPEIADHTEVMKNNDRKDVKGISVTAIPMYNLPQSAESFHTKGRGNGYLLERDGYRVYIAGDTSNTPEMRALTDIDLAFIPMNLPYTMSVEEAAEAVKAFKPAKVYPYHYRGQDGLSDVNKFKTLVEEANVGTKVVLLNWYPNQ